MASTRWTIRRRIIVASLAFCGGVILISLFKTDLDPTVSQTAITQAFVAGMAIIGSYVFGAVWDDKNNQATIERKTKTTESITIPTEGELPE